ncbi:unnamed protein product [Ectocarpus sp. 13 AM-2016]
MSDPPHRWKKIVNSLHQSDLPWQSRKLARLWVDPVTGEYDLVPFFLKTLEKVYYNEELGGGAFTQNEQVATLQRFGNMRPEQFNWNSYNNMNVGLAAKNLSGSAVRACNSANAKLVANGQAPNAEIACYAELAH